jgi:fumarate reductase flavoprotein subunit
MTDWDVAIVGAGPAGMTAAIAAGERGARVVVIEAAEKVGGALHLSSASYSAAGNARQAARGIEDSPQRHYDDCLRINHGTGDKYKLRLWTETSGPTLDWLFDLGLQMGDNQPEHNTAHERYSVERIYTPPRAGYDFIDVLKPVFDRLIAEGRIVLKLGTRMTDLLPDDAGGVRGLKAVKGGETIEIEAANVVLACGGYAHNPKYWREFHGLPGNTYSYPFSMGDGLGAARALGAKVGNTEHHLPTVGGTFDIDAPGNCWINTRTSAIFRQPWEIFVNLDGRRFMQEDKLGRDWRERVMINQPEQAFWAIYDEGIRREAPPFFLMPEEKVERAFRYHEDYRRAETIEQLAEICNLPPKTLRATIERYNAGQAVGYDEMGKEFLPRPIVEAPFYAVKHHSLSVVSFGGLVTDEDFQVLKVDDAPIDRLYAIGEILGQGTFGNAFLGGGMVSSAISFGKLLGERILRW